MKAITISEHGGPEVMKFSEIPLPEVGPDQVLVQISTAGVNFIDIYQRSGLYPLELPAIPGLEGAGQVVESGRQVKNFEPGDNVAFCDTLGAYAEYAVVRADRLVALPDSLLPSDAAAIMLQGITACYLLTETYSLKSGDRCLIHAAAGGVGQLLVQMAARVGAYIIGTTSTEKKAKIVRELGANEVINYVEQDFESAVRELTNGEGVNVVYDSVGATTFEKGLNCLAPRGMMVLFGQSSGAVPRFDPAILNTKGSLFLTRPSLFHHIANTADLQRYAKTLFGSLVEGELKVTIDKSFPLQKAAEAHEYLNCRRSIGKIVLTSR